MRRVIWLVAPFALAACKGEPARLVVGNSDTVLVNSRGPVQLPVRVLDAGGRGLEVSGLRYETRAGDSLRVSGLGRVTCTRRADGEVRVRFGHLSAPIHILCRPVEGFRFHFDDTPPLVPGGPSRDLHLDAVGTDGKPVTLLAGTMTVSDSTVASVRELTVFPKSSGYTTVELDIGHCVLMFEVEVHERATDPLQLRGRHQLFAVYPLRLVDGEMRSWRLPRGEYRVGLSPEAGRGAELLLSTRAMNCVDYPGVAQDRHCAALPGASVIVRNPRPAGGGGVLSGDFFINRWDEPPVGENSPAMRPRTGTQSRKPWCRSVR
jgi:hypothetical protein